MKAGEMWTRSMVCESRYVIATVLGRVRYGVISMSGSSRTRKDNARVGRSYEGGKLEEENLAPSASKHVYSRSILRCRIAATIRRTKLEAGVGTGGEEWTRRRSGKRVQTYATETVKLIRRRTTRGWRISYSDRNSTGGSIQAYEYPILIMLATTGLMRLVNANDRIGIYVAIEWLSLCLYVMAAFRRGSAYSTEAGLKYYVVGAFGSAWMLLGMTLVYGWRGSFNRLEIERRRGRVSGEEGVEWILCRIGWEFVRGALLLKLAGVPRHRWLADVYEGAPRSTVLYFAVVPKIALFRVRMRRVSVWYVQTGERVGNSMATLPVTKRRIAVSVRSMAVGAIGALTQRRRKRFRAYSAIGHTGYILLGTRRGTVEGVQGVRVYTIVYRVMTMVMWQRRMVVKVYENGGSTGRTGIQVRDAKYRTDRFQLGKENPVLGIRIARTCMSMAGVPPMAGFGAKRSVFRALIASSYYRLGARAVVRSVIGAFNYVRRVKRMFFEENVNSNKSEEVGVVMSKEISRRRGREGRFRTGLRIHPSSLLLLTHRMALEVVSR
jgi:proton-translocating NADH-quinone oxidoreductase chain N